MKILLIPAYLDPASGSIWFQVILGTLFGGLSLTRRFWTGLLSRIRSR